MYIGLLEAAAGRGPAARLRLCVSGGASLPVAVLERFNEAFGTTIFEGYGLSETSPTATTNQPHFGTRPARSATRSGASRWRSPGPRSTTASSCCPPASWARSSSAATTSSPATSAGRRRPRGDRRRLVPHRRPRHQGRGGLHLHRGPQEGHHHPGRLQRLPARGRGGAGPAPGGRPGRGHRRAGPGARRGDLRGRGGGDPDAARWTPTS